MSSRTASCCCGQLRIEARDIVDELNIAMKWLGYPGRRNGVARAAQVDFGAAGGGQQPTQAVA